jgi:hypothetical protein
VCLCGGAERLSAINFPDLKNDKSSSQIGRNRATFMPIYESQTPVNIDILIRISSALTKVPQVFTHSIKAGQLIPVQCNMTGLQDPVPTSQYA